jgi:protein pelota
MIKEACDAKASADLAAVVMEMGLAHVCLVTKTMTLTRAKIELSVVSERSFFSFSFFFFCIFF